MVYLLFVIKSKTVTYRFRIVGFDEDYDYDGSVDVEAIAAEYVVVRKQPVRGRKKKTNYRCRLGVCVVDDRKVPSKNLKHCHYHHCRATISFDDHRRRHRQT